MIKKEENMSVISKILPLALQFLLPGTGAGILAALLTSGNGEDSDSKDSSMIDDIIKDYFEAQKNNPAYQGGYDSQQMSPMDAYSYVSDDNLITNSFAKYFGTELSNAEKEANYFNYLMQEDAQAFNHNEAVFSRQWQEHVERNKYQWNTQSMINAGLNPAMLYGGGNLVGTQATGAMASSSAGHSVNPSQATLGDLIAPLMSLVRMPFELNLLKAETDKTVKEGNAAAMNANTNAKNAGTNAENAETNRRNAEVNERNASVNELKVQIERDLADSNISVNEAQKAKIAQETANLLKTWNQMDDYIAIAYQNADSQHKSAIAALQNANAAVRNAAVNEKKSDYDIAMMEAKAALEWANAAGQDIINQRLDEKTRAEIREIQSRGYYFNEQGKLCDKYGNLATAQTIETYTRAAAEVSSEIRNWINPFAKAGKAAQVGRVAASLVDE